MQKYVNTITNIYGDRVSGATITVTTLAGAAATIYTGNGTGLITGNSVTSDSNGQFVFYADNGRYTLTISGTGITTYTLPDILIYEADLASPNFSGNPTTTTQVYSDASTRIATTRFVKDSNNIPTFTIGATATANAAVILAMLTASGSAYIPVGTSVTVDALAMPDNTVLFGGGTIKYVSGANQCVTLGKNCVVSGLNFTPSDGTTYAKWVVYVRSGSNNVNINNCIFTGNLPAASSYVGLEQFIYIENNAPYALVSQNIFNNGVGAILAIDSVSGIFADNIMNTPGTLGGIQCYGGKYNFINGNKIFGRNSQDDSNAIPTIPYSTNKSTLVGINFLTFGWLGSNRGIVGNIISDNEVYGVTGEAIGLDTNGDNVVDSAENQVLPAATIFATSNTAGRQVLTLQQTTLQNSVAAATSWADNCYMIVLSGAATGAIKKIIKATSSASANTATITVSREATALPIVNGDKILISYGIIDNIISDNIVKSSSTGISLWGSCWWNKVTGNSVEAIGIGIQVASVVSGLVPGANISGNNTGGVQGYSGCNEVIGNTVYLDYPGQSDAQSATYNRGTTVIAVGTWAYGTPFVNDQNPGMIVANNTVPALTVPPDHPM